jgi:myo-inositol-1(or 4)-monophosphatase
MDFNAASAKISSIRNLISRADIMEIDNKRIAQILETATVAARLAGQRAMELIGYAKKIEKSENELVTTADTQCQEIIIERIKENFPDHGFLGEESNDGHLLKIAPRGENIWWVIDPIDGTNNYASGIPYFAVSIGVIADGKPVAGVIFQPSTESMFTAAINTEAALNNSRITCGSEPLTNFSNVGIDGHFKDKIPAWQNRIMLMCRFRNFGTTAMQLAYVANGGLVGTASHYPKIWDIAAGVIIAKQAGAVITDWKGNKIENFDVANYNREPYEILVANPKAHKQLLDIING